MPKDAKTQSLAECLQEELADVEVLRHAPLSLFADLAGLVYGTSALKDRINRRAVGVEWGRDAQRVARDLKPALDRLREVLRVRPLLDHEFEKVLPDWRAHLAALHLLIPVAQKWAQDVLPVMPRRGRPSKLPHRLALDVADVLDRHGIRLTRGERGAFGKVLGLMLSSLDNTRETDVAALTKAVIDERRTRASISR
jgi:hypothetical protein